MANEDAKKQDTSAEGGHSLGVCFSGGRWVTSGDGPPSLQMASPLQQVPEFKTSPPANPFLERADTMEAFTTRSGMLEGGSPKSERAPSIWRMSGIAVGDLFQITTDPKVQKRVMKADTDNDGRISRKDILKVMQSEATAKQKLKWGLIIGGALLLLCLLMLAANAGLTYAVVSMSKETHVQSSGVMTAKDGDTVVGTAQAAMTADLLYAYHTPAEAGAALLSLKQLLITDEDGTLCAFQVLSTTLVPGKRLDCVVTAPAATTAVSGAAAELIRIVIDETGVHEVRSGSASGDGAASGGRRLLATPASRRAGVRGLLSSTTTYTCGPYPGSCSSAGNQLSCPTTPTCGMNGKAYSSPCAARLAGTSVKCTNCGPSCSGAAALVGSNTRPSGLPPNLAWDGPDFVRTPPASDSTNNGGIGTLAPTVTKPPTRPPTTKNVRRPRN